MIVGTLQEALDSIDVDEYRHVVSLSGGKDSTALALYLKQNYPEIPAEYIFCDTGVELPETYEYLERLEVDAVFAVTRFGQTKVVKAALSPESTALFVLGAQGEEAVKPWSLAKVTCEDGCFVHESRGTFFTPEGAEKQFTLIQGLPWEGGDSIDDYC